MPNASYESALSPSVTAGASGLLHGLHAQQIAHCCCGANRSVLEVRFSRSWGPHIVHISGGLASQDRPVEESCNLGTTGPLQILGGPSRSLPWRGRAGADERGSCSDGRDEHRRRPLQTTEHVAEGARHLRGAMRSSAWGRRRTRAVLE